MALLLENVVPWGRTRAEYIKMFSLSDSDLSKKIASFGDGPASFNYESTINDCDVISFDIIYQFSKEEIETQINKTREIVLTQMKQNMENYIWTDIKTVDELEKRRIGAMKLFLDDYNKGKADGRYLYHELPNKTKYEENYFDIGLSSHFLLMYTKLGYEFHIKTITEMLRICREIRITPIVTLDGEHSELTMKIIEYFENEYAVRIINTNYNFLKNGNQMLCITKKSNDMP
jgi:hypothetical protein